jgi:hypothetical protein
MGKTISIGVIHAPRKIDFIGWTLDSIRSEFEGIRPTVFCEPDCDNFRGMSLVDTVKHNIKYGSYLNWVFGLRFMYRYTTADYILMCEDDVEIHEGASKKLLEGCEQYRDKKVGFFSLWASQANANPRSPGWGIAKFSRNGWCGALALCLPRESAKAFIDYTDKPDDTKDLDTTVGRVFLRLGYQLIIHTPTLVTHLGNTISTIVEEDHPLLTEYQRQPYVEEYDPFREASNRYQHIGEISK